MSSHSLVVSSHCPLVYVSSLVSNMLVSKPRPYEWRGRGHHDPRSLICTPLLPVLHKLPFSSCVNISVVSTSESHSIIK